MGFIPNQLFQHLGVNDKKKLVKKQKSSEVECDHMISAGESTRTGQQQVCRHLVTPEDHTCPHLQVTRCGQVWSSGVPDRNMNPSQTSSLYFLSSYLSSVFCLSMSYLSFWLCPLLLNVFLLLFIIFVSMFIFISSSSFCPPFSSFVSSSRSWSLSLWMVLFCHCLLRLSSCSSLSWFSLFVSCFLSCDASCFCFVFVVLIF